jgi:hypothetical protein
MGRESARFQARSAFTGVGFTTSEAESVVGHPVRRRVVMWLMLVGNVGIVTAVATLMLSFIDMRGSGSLWLEVLVLLAGVSFLIFFATSQWVDRWMCGLISWALKRYTDLDTRDYAKILHLREDYGVTELRISKGDWLVGKSVGDSGLAREGVLVLGIECPGGRFLGAPRDDTPMRAGDRLVLYGRTPRIAEIDSRAHGVDAEANHRDAVEEHERVTREERTLARR